MINKRTRTKTIIAPSSMISCRSNRGASDAWRVSAERPTDRRKRRAALTDFGLVSIQIRCPPTYMGITAAICRVIEMRECRRRCRRVSEISINQRRSLLAIIRRHLKLHAIVRPPTLIRGGLVIF